MQIQKTGCQSYNQKNNKQTAFGLKLTIKPKNSVSEIDKYISTEEINNLVEFFKNKGLKSDYADLKIGNELTGQSSSDLYKITGDMAIFSEPIQVEIERNSKDKASEVIKSLISYFVN